MIKRFGEFEKDDCCPECGLPISECGCEPNCEEPNCEECGCGKPECNCGTEEMKETKSFNDFFVNEDATHPFANQPGNPFYKKPKNKSEKLKDLLELVSDVDIMFHEERQEYFFEWMKDGKFVTIWLNDYL